MSRARRFRDEWPTPLDALAADLSVLPDGWTDEDVARGVWCGTCGRMVAVTQHRGRGKHEYEVAWHAGPTGEPCCESGRAVGQ